MRTTWKIHWENDEKFLTDGVVKVNITYTRRQTIHEILDMYFEAVQDAYKSGLKEGSKITEEVWR